MHWLENLPIELTWFIYIYINPVFIYISNFPEPLDLNTRNFKEKVERYTSIICFKGILKYHESTSAQ